MNSMKIGTYQMDTSFGLYLPEYTIPAPTPQTHFVQIIGRDGSVDLSEAIGLHYDSRVWDLDFKCFDPTVNWHTLTSQVMNAIHGKRLNFEFDDDPNYFWTGRVSVSSYVSNHGTGTLKINITSDPFKYAKLSTIVTKNASTGTDYTGALVSFNTANAKINDVSVTMQPIQSLNGYSAPWPAGGGVNKFGVTDVTDLANGTSRKLSISDGLMTVTATGGTSSVFVIGQSVLAQVIENATLPAGTYYYKIFDYSSTVTGATADGIKVRIATNGTNTDYARDTAFTLTADSTIVGFYVASALQWNSGNTMKLRVAISATNVDAWTPYSNICPITGRTGLSVYVSPTQDQQDATTYAVDWTSQAGTVYGGTLDVVTGVLTVTHKILDLGTKSWLKAIGSLFYSEDSAFDGATDPNGEYLLCSQYMGGDAYGGNIDNTIDIRVGTTKRIWIKDSSKTGLTGTQFKAAMNGVQLVYLLATPLTYQLTPQEVATLVGQNNVWSDSGDVSVTVVTPETVTNNGLAVVPTLTASADMVLKWGNYSASVQQGTSTVPQLILENGANLICIIGTGTLSFAWQEESL